MRHTEDFLRARVLKPWTCSHSHIKVFPTPFGLVWGSLAGRQGTKQSDPPGPFHCWDSKKTPKNATSRAVVPSGSGEAERRWTSGCYLLELSSQRNGLPQWDAVCLWNLMTRLINPWSYSDRQVDWGFHHCVLFCTTGFILYDLFPSIFSFPYPTP